MRWIETKKAIGNNNESTRIFLELFMDFPHSQWNKKDHSPVAFLTYYERHDMIYKTCSVKFTFPRLPELFYTESNWSHKYPDGAITLDMCKKRVEEYLKEYLSSLLNQLLDDSEKIDILSNEDKISVNQ